MNLINDKQEMDANIKHLDAALQNRDKDALNLIKRGRCFVCVKNQNGLSFYPSKFIGYQNNTISAHEATKAKTLDGRRTNEQISKAVYGGVAPKQSALMEKEYEKYCATLGVPVTKNQRKYWV
jgi:hypothetical protein